MISKEIELNNICVTAVLVCMLESGQRSRRAEAAGKFAEEQYAQRCREADAPLGHTLSR